MSPGTEELSTKRSKNTPRSGRHSSIPQSVSLTNRTSSSNGRLSVAQASLPSARRSISGHTVPGASANPRNIVPGSRSSNSASQAVLRRSSVFSRPSTHDQSRHSFFIRQAPTMAEDPRPLRDRAYQARIGQELLEYLAQNNFESQMGHSLGQHALRSPTQKDFNYVFQWLYHRIDPNYKFQKAMDSEVSLILKHLRYPYEKGITKSQIAAVGGQNWPTFLGMLHWLMQLARMMERYVQGDYDEACLTAGVDVTGDRISHNFLVAAYHVWLQGGEDEDDDMAEQRLIPLIEQMSQQLARANEPHAQELEALEAKNRALRDQIAELEKKTPDMAKLDKQFHTMEGDKRKFEDYNNQVRGKIEKYEHRIRNVDREIQKTDAEQQENEALQARAGQQGITIQGIDRMRTEQDRLQTSLENAQARHEETCADVFGKEAEHSQRLKDLEELVKKYNTLGYKCNLIPRSAKNAKGQIFELSLDVPQDQHSASQMDRPMHGDDSTKVLNLDLSGIQSCLQSLSKEIRKRQYQKVEENQNARDQLDTLEEALNEKRSELDALEHRKRAAQEEFDCTKSHTTSQKMTSDAHIEKMETELAKMRSTLTDSVQLEEQREMQTNIEYEQLTHRADALREELHTNVELMLNDVIRFKVHVQKGLEDYESFVVDEVEQELGGGHVRGGTALMCPLALPLFSPCW